MKSKTVDILISGGGVAGLTAAAAFGAAGFDVICVDPTPPGTDRNAIFWTLQAFGIAYLISPPP
jgi:2-polyprenyl-6-methoxyphenol hydroxylase-like FAD-dependent oxidoreductase